MGRIAFVVTILLGTVLASPATAATSTWADYSLMFGRNAGQARTPDGTPATQWAWTPVSPTASDIRWGDPATWDSDPVPYAEHFSVEGDWVLLSGWDDNGTTYRQTMTAEWGGDCANMTPLPPDPQGRQHYVRWEVPATEYCLRGEGTITEASSGTTFTFAHEQRWSPPAPCTSRFQGEATCISQYETWADNNYGDHTGPLRQTLARTVQLAEGRGMAYTVRTTVPQTWAADGYATWQY